MHTFAQTNISISWEVIRNTKRQQTHPLNISISEIPLMPIINKGLLSFPKIWSCAINILKWNREKQGHPSAKVTTHFSLCNIMR